MDRAEMDAPRAAALAKVLLKHRWEVGGAAGESTARQRYYAPVQAAEDRYYARYAHQGGEGGGPETSQIRVRVHPAPCALRPAPRARAARRGRRG
jgi:hypothetical protein